MLRINSFLHRQRLLEITRRWFYNHLEPEDFPALKAIINFNSIWLSRVGKAFAEELFSSVISGPIYERRVSNKGALKALLVATPREQTPRVQQLVRRYRENPERYFRETPFSGVLYEGEHEGAPVYLGSRRVKRVRRIAEKGARRISDKIYEQIKERANGLAQQRADAMRIPKSQLITPPDQMSFEFERAERRIATEIKKGHLFRESFEFVLDDVLGVKIILPEEKQYLVLDWLSSSSQVNLLEIEHHRGFYNATNVVFEYYPRREVLLENPLQKQTLIHLRSRGMNPCTAEHDFQSFVNQGEPSLHIELILCSDLEMLESEIGRTMHEDRIVQQRTHQVYRGHLARNVRSLMEFIFACGIAPCTSIEAIPIHVWIQYMPDYFDEVMKDLFGIPKFRELE